MAIRYVRTLAGFLARHGAITQQGEPLCTQGLAYLLEDEGAKSRFAAFLAARCHVAVSDNLRWVAEATLADKGRPDLEGRSVDRTPVVMIEAKLGAEFGRQQLRSYATDLGTRNTSGDGVLVVLVPKHRVETVTAEVRGEFGLAEDERSWRLAAPAIVVTVLAWDGLLDVLTAEQDGQLNHDIEQLRGMYLTLAGLDIAPVTAPELTNWRKREADFKRLVDRTTRVLIKQSDLPVYPMANENGYLRRYVGRKVRGEWVFFSIGVRDPIAPHREPIWLRYHSDTPMFGQIEQRMGVLDFTVERSAGHLWIPMPTKDGASGEEIVDDLVAQAEAIHAAVWLGI